MAQSKGKIQLVDKQIEQARNDIRTDKLDITFGELSNLYDNGELIIRPEFQRLFRWSPTQKTRFIESILLGFPTPAIFVSEDTDGIWELVDGLQRLSTVFEFMGVLKDASGNAVPPSELAKLGHKPRIPSMAGIRFAELSLQARLSIKRAGCRVEVIKVGSKPTMKYEVFERLNTGGSGLTAQEVRNCIFRATNPEFIEWIEELGAFSYFHDNLGLSEYQESTMFDRGLVLRYLTVKNAYQEFEHDVEPFVTDFIRQVLEGERDLDREEETNTFEKTFRRIAESMGEDSWRHYRDGRHAGPFSVYVFETVSVGVALNIGSIIGMSSEALKERIVKFKEHRTFVDNTGAGANIKSKFLGRMTFAISYFAG